MNNAHKPANADWKGNFLEKHTDEIDSRGDAKCECTCCITETESATCLLLLLSLKTHADKVTEPGWFYR